MSIATNSHLSRKVAFLALLSLSLIPLATAWVNVPAKNVPPNNMSPADTPQIVVVTTDDECTDNAGKNMVSMMNQVTNPNGCTAPMTFFCTMNWSTCTALKRLYNLGHEIATHTMTHPDLKKMTYTAKRNEIVGARRYAIDTCGLPAGQVRGFRAPYLSASPGVRKALKNNYFLYDASIPELFNSPESPSGNQRLWPSTMGDGIAQMYSVKWYGNMSGANSYEKYDYLGNIPLSAYMVSSKTPAGSLMDPDPVYDTLMREFQRNYNGNRAIVGLWGHHHNYYSRSEIRSEGLRFLKDVRKYPDVWILTMRQVYDYMQAPVPKSQMAAFMSKYKCGNSSAF